MEITLNDETSSNFLQNMSSFKSTSFVDMDIIFHFLMFLIILSDGSRVPGLCWKDGIVVSGTLEDLIHNLVPR